MDKGLLPQKAILLIVVIKLSKVIFLLFRNHSPGTTVIEAELQLSATVEPTNMCGL